MNITKRELEQATRRAIYSDNIVIIKNGTTAWLTIARPFIDIEAGTLTYKIMGNVTCNILSIENTPASMMIVCDTCKIIYTL